MGRLIELDAASDIVRLECGKWVGLANTIIKEFYALKPIDAVPVRHGHWNGGADDASCSACGRNLLDFFSYTEYCGVYEYPNFCPNCGAKMVGKDGGNHE